MNALVREAEGPAVAAADPTALDTLLSQVRERRAEFTRQRQLPADIVQRFKQVGVYRALLPRAFGGDERSPRQFCELIERIAQADGSSGWVASFGVSVTYLAGLPAETFASIYANSPDVVFAAGIFPPQPAPRVDGGFRVNGRWSFASGSTGADLIAVGIVPAAEGEKPRLPRLAVLPSSKVQIERTWDVTGMVGTGSHDVIVHDQVVPEAWTFVRGAKSARTEAIFRYPTLSLATQVLSVCGLGIARGAIEELRTMAGGKPSVTGAPRLADRPQTQIEIARAEAQLRAARAFFYDAIDEAWEHLRHHEALTPELVNMLRLSSTHATRTSAEVTRAVQLQSGMAGIYEACPISQQVRDAQVLTQHAFMGDITYQNAGAMLFGLPPLPGYL